MERLQFGDPEAIAQRDSARVQNDSHWRARARFVIATALQDNQALPDKEARKLVRSLYPFGESKYHPYKIWLSEVKKQFAIWRPVRSIQP